MRKLLLLLAIFLLAACSSTPVQRVESPAVSPTQVPAPVQNASIDSVVEFLITSAATDFKTHRPPDPVGFRDVRVGHVATPGGEKRYMLCGQFLPAQGEDKAKWTPFATIKTSGYEQWLGSQAAGYCNDKSVVWEKPDDLSSALQNRFDSLR